MGTGIAMNFLNAGVPVTLVETSEDMCGKTIAKVKDTYQVSAFQKLHTLVILCITPNLKYREALHSRKEN